MIVVDTNILVYLFGPSISTELTEKALAKDSIWSAPRIWRSEYRNVLVTYIRKEIITLEAGVKIMNKCLQFLQGLEYDVDSARVLALAATSQCSAYDCEFVALAEKLDVLLVTVDKQILAQFPNRAISLLAFVLDNSADN